MVNKSRQLSGSLRKKMKNIFKEEYFSKRTKNSKKDTERDRENRIKDGIVRK